MVIRVGTALRRFCPRGWILRCAVPTLRTQERNLMLLRLPLLAALLLPGGAAAQEFPTRPVTMVVPFAAGGPIDVLGRLLQGPMAEALGQPVVIENISGGGGMVGSNKVKQAAPDGYQI